MRRAFLGRLALVRIYKGKLRKGQQVAWMREVDGLPVITNAKITELLATEGVERTATDEAIAGDIVAVAGLPEIMIGDTLADPEHAHALPRITCRRAGHLGDDRHQHFAAGGQGVGPQAHRSYGPQPAGHRAGRQRLDPGCRYRPAGRVGGAGPRRAGARRARRDNAPGRVRAHCRQAAGGDQDDRRSSCTSRSRR